jgi:hypothetical protein
MLLRKPSSNRRQWIGARLLAFLRAPTLEAWLVRAIGIGGLTAVASIQGSAALAHGDSLFLGVVGVICGVLSLPGLIPFMLLGGVHGPLSDTQGLIIVSVGTGCFWATLIPRLRRRRPGDLIVR